MAKCLGFSYEVMDARIDARSVNSKFVFYPASSGRLRKSGDTIPILGKSGDTIRDTIPIFPMFLLSCDFYLILQLKTS